LYKGENDHEFLTNIGETAGEKTSAVIEAGLLLLTLCSACAELLQVVGYRCDGEGCASGNKIQSK